ncbi:MAG: LamG-like jellyroll fold domain-containing protein [Planctomycetota bacterium]
MASRAMAADPPAQHTTLGDGDVGAVLSSGKPYFPMLLENGMEHVLIGYSGAMGACAGHEQWSYGTTDTGWFRPDRRTCPSRGVLNLLQCGYIVRRGIHADGIDTAEQVFDARTGSLVTECRFANAGIRVTTFLTADHLLVHRFAVSTDAEDMWMQFFIRTPVPRGPLAVGINPRQSQLPEKLCDRVLAFTVRGEGWTSTVGRLFCDHPRAKRTICYNQQAGIEVPLQGVSAFTFVVQCSDAEDNQDAGASIESVDRFDYARTLDRHQTEWRQFDARSAVQVSYGAIDDIYRTSLYTVRAHQHPEMGGITVGAYPGMWSNGINSYDVSYSLMALLGANRMDEAERVVRFWQQILPLLRQRANEERAVGTVLDVRFDEGEGIRARDSSSWQNGLCLESLSDESCHSAAFKKVEMPSPWVPHGDGFAMAFGPRGAWHALGSNTKTLCSPARNNQLTLEADVRLPAEGPGFPYGIISVHYSYALLMKEDGTLNCGLTLEDGPSVWAVAPQPLKYDEWQHVTAVYDGREATLYVDGKRVVSTTCPDGARLRLSPHGLRVGYYATRNWVNGENVAPPVQFLLDNLRVSNQAEPPSER